MQEMNVIQTFAIWVLPVLFAITLHEVAHGWVAMKLGDPTAKMLGRLTINPVKHIDPLGTILIPGFLMVAGGFIFGWAKPVPITWENLKNARRDIALVALAGPLSNLLMALLWAVVMKLGLELSDTTSSWTYPLVLMGDAGIAINLMLMVLNLLPILPLDGGRVLNSILPPKIAYHFSKSEPYGLFIVLGLFFLGALGWVLTPAVNALRVMMYQIIGL